MEYNICDACIPLPLQIVIDDVGWWSGSNDSAKNGPFRTGINRNHTPADYSAIAELGKQLGIRPQAAMILAEWDRDNILADIPSATWMGKNWKNPFLDIEKFEEAAQIINDSKEYFEFVLHGVGHEFWHQDGSVSRAEWYDETGQMRPLDDVVKHLEAYEIIMQQNSLGNFPTSFVPCAFRYCFADDENGLLPLLKSRGINYISSPFDCMDTKAYKPQFKHFGIDREVITVDRDYNKMPWYIIDADPDTMDLDNKVICGLHWPNILNENPDKNSETISRWVKYFKSLAKDFKRILSENTAAHRAQLIYNELVELDINENIINIDFTKYFEHFDSHQPEGFVLHVKGNAGFRKIKVKPENNQKSLALPT